MKIFGVSHVSYIIVSQDFHLFLQENLKEGWEIEKSWSIAFTPFEVLKVRFQ